MLNDKNISNHCFLNQNSDRNFDRNNSRIPRSSVFEKSTFSATLRSSEFFKNFCRENGIPIRISVENIADGYDLFRSIFAPFKLQNPHKP